MKMLLVYIRYRYKRFRVLIYIIKFRLKQVRKRSTRFSVYLRICIKRLRVYCIFHFRKSKRIMYLKLCIDLLSPDTKKNKSDTSTAFEHLASRFVEKMHWKILDFARFSKIWPKYISNDFEILFFSTSWIKQ